MNLREVTPPSAEPVSLPEARLQCKVDVISGNSHPDDALILTLTSAARRAVEEFTNCITTDAEYEFRCPGPVDGFIVLPRGPVDSIAWVKYLDQDEALQTLDAATYYLDDNPWAPMIGLKKNQSWPSIYGRRDALRVRLSGGFNSPTTVPHDLVLAMKLLIGHWYKNREDSAGGATMSEIPMGAKVLMMPHRRGMGV